MSGGVVARRYARALFDIASEKRLFDKFEQDLNLLNDTLKMDPDVQRMLTHPRVVAEVKKNTVKQAFSGKMSEDVLSLLLLLIDRGREEVIPELVKEFVVMANEAQNIVDATVYTTTLLNEAELSKLSNEFGKSIGKTIRLKAMIDPSIIGGLIIRIGDQLFDGSVQGKLARFKQALVRS